MSANASRRIFFSMPSGPTIFRAGSRLMATSRNSRSRNGTRASTPHAAMLLLARRQSKECSRSSLRTVSSWKLAGVGRLVEVQVAAEHLVRALAGEHHLDAHGPDAARHQVHRRRRADGGDVVGLQVVDHVGQRVQPFLHGEVELVVHGADVLGHLAGRRQVRRALQPDGEGVQLRPPRFAAVVVLDAPRGIAAWRWPTRSTSPARRRGARRRARRS